MSLEVTEVEKNTDVPRSFADYTVAMNDADMPTGVTVSKLV
ncbi:hypothetical protein [Rhodanobacter lindaniclasticus]